MIIGASFIVVINIGTDSVGPMSQPPSQNSPDTVRTRQSTLPVPKPPPPPPRHPTPQAPRRRRRNPDRDPAARHHTSLRRHHGAGPRRCRRSEGDASSPNRSIFQLPEGAPVKDVGAVYSCMLLGTPLLAHQPRHTQLVAQILPISPGSHPRLVCSLPSLTFLLPWTRLGFVVWAVGLHSDGSCVTYRLLGRFRGGASLDQK